MRGAGGAMRSAPEGQFRPRVLCSVEAWRLASFSAVIPGKPAFCGCVNEIGSRSTRSKVAIFDHPYPPPISFQWPPHTHILCGYERNERYNEAHRQSHHRTRFQAAAYFLLRERMRRKIRSKPIGKAALVIQATRAEWVTAPGMAGCARFATSAPMDSRGCLARIWWMDSQARPLVRRARRFSGNW